MIIVLVITTEGNVFLMDLCTVFGLTVFVRFSKYRNAVVVTVL